MGLLATLGGCGKPTGKKPSRDLPVVIAARPVPHNFVDWIEAVGTARANEQVTLAAPVTDRITRLNFADGGYVRAGQVIAVLAQGAETASLAGAMAAERQANQQLDRIRSLSARGFATKSVLDEQVSAAARASASAGEARAQIGDRVIRAPFGGYASLRTISTGAIVNAGMPIATISDISRIKLDFTIPERLLRAIRPGQAIAAVAAAYPETPFRGTITTIDPVIDPSTRAVLVRAILPNPGNRLKPGMLLTVGVESASRAAMAVPELAVIGEGSTHYVYVVGKDDKAARVAVTTGTHDDGLIEVRGLKADALVIGEGVVKVTEGTRVRVAGAAGKRPGKSQAGE